MPVVETNSGIAYLHCTLYCSFLYKINEFAELANKTNKTDGGQYSLKERTK